MTKKKVSESLIKFNAPEALKEELIRLASVRNISLSALIRLIVSEYIKNKG
jgi:hypothetical protein